MRRFRLFQSKGENVIRALRVFWLALKDLFEEFVLLLTVNVAWSILCLPLLLASWASLRAGLLELAIVVSLLAALPLGPASVALCVVANQISQGIVSSWRQFFRAMGQYALVSWKVFGLWYLGLLLILVDIWFYSGVGNLIGATLTIFWMYMLLIWLGLLIYLLPLLVLQEEARLWRIWRTAAALTFGRPLFTLTQLVLLVAMVVVSVLLPLLLVLVTVSLLTLVGVRSTRTLLDEAEAAREEAQAAAQSAPESKERGRRGQVRPRE